MKRPRIFRPPWLQGGFTNKLFKDRLQAGTLLGQRLKPFAGRAGVVVLALPRGGVPLGLKVAQALGAPLDVLLVRKLGLPGHAEFAIGAVAAEGPCLLQHDIIRLLGVSSEQIASLVARERAEIVRRAARYRASRPTLQLREHIVILVDDGLATGATMRMAVTVVRQSQPAKIIVAVPVGASDTCAALASEVDELICLHTPDPFMSVGQWYQDFAQVSDDEVIALLAQSPHLPDQQSRTAPLQHDAT